VAFLGLVSLGHSLRGFSPSGLLIRHCRPDLLPWPIDEPAPAHRTGLVSIPLQSQPTQ
jgi:hypothetical protein